MAIRDLSPKRVLTVHYSKYALGKHPWYEPLNAIYGNSDGQPYRLLPPEIGERVDLRDTAGMTEKWW